MAILNISPQLPAAQVGLVGVSPSIRYIYTDDTTATVTTAGYLNKFAANYEFQNSEMALVYTTDDDASWYGLSIDTDGIITLVGEGTPGTVVLPVVDGNFAVFTGTSGVMADDGFSPSDPAKSKVVMASAAVTANHIACFSDTDGTVNDDPATAITSGNLQAIGDITAGENDTAGTFIAYPSNADSGYFKIAAANASGDHPTTLQSHPNILQDSTYILGDSATATQYIPVSSLSPGGSVALMYGRDTNATFTSLGSGGAAGIISGAGYKIRGLWLNKAGTNFSGGGGDRDIQITDGTNVYSVIPAATAQSLANAVWGDTALPLPVTASINTTTVSTLVIAYSGGTTDYTAGSLTVSVLLEKVA